MITGSYLKKIISCVLIINLLILCGCGDSGATPSTRENAETKEEYEAALYTARTTPYGKYPEQIIPISRMARRMKIMLIQGC